MNTGFSTLRQFARQRVPEEKCELCGGTIFSQHQHLIEPKTRQLTCACDSCAILFSDQESGRFKRVPREIRFLPDFQLTDAQWDELMIPINMAFFFSSTPESRIIALYPGPAGAVESLLRLESWEAIVQSNPSLQNLSPDVEALLVNRLQAPYVYYVAPMDECYKLVGIIRAGWRGLSGGKEVWSEIRQFFEDLQKRATHRYEEARRA